MLRMRVTSISGRSPWPLFMSAGAPIRPANSLPLALVWRAGSDPILNGLVMRIWLEDNNGRSVAIEMSRWEMDSL